MIYKSLLPQTFTCLQAVFLTCTLLHMHHSATPTLCRDWSQVLRWCNLGSCPIGKTRRLQTIKKRRTWHQQWCSGCGELKPHIARGVHPQKYVCHHVQVCCAYSYTIANVVCPHHALLLLNLLYYCVYKSTLKGNHKQGFLTFMSPYYLKFDIFL